MQERELGTTCCLLPAASRRQLVHLLACLLTRKLLLPARIDCLVSPLYRKRKLMTPMEAKEVLGMCVGECKRQAVEATKLNVRQPQHRPTCCMYSSRDSFINRDTSVLFVRRRRSLRGLAVWRSCRPTSAKSTILY